MSYPRRAALNMYALLQVAHGGWLHVFPEGRIMFTGRLGPFRWGVGKVVCDAKRASGGRSVWEVNNTSNI